VKTINREIYRIISDKNKSDDFAQAVNIGCICIWYDQQKFPTLKLPVQ